MPLNYDTTPTYTPCPEGSYPAICVQAIELGVQPGYQGGPDKAQIYLAFEMTGTSRDDGQPFVLGKRYTVTLFEKGNLYPVASALLGRVPTSSEFNPKDLLGKACLAQVIHKNRTDGGVNAAVSSVVPMPSGMDTPTPENDLLFYDWNNPDRKLWSALPEWLQKTIDQGKDQSAPKLEVVSNETRPDEEVGGEFNQDIPFNKLDGRYV